MLKANYLYIEQVFSKYYFKGRKRVHRDDCIKIFTTYSKLGLDDSSARFCFGMSKMTPENELFYYQNLDMEFVEFLEMICRVADIKFKGTELESINLHTKVGYVIDEILIIIEIYRRNEVDPGKAEMSESDEDY